MAVWPFQAQQVVESLTAAIGTRSELSPTPPFGWPSGWPSTDSGMDSPVTRAEALAVPAVTRAIDLMATTVAAMPVEHIRVDAESGQRSRVQLPVFMEQPEGDLIFLDKADSKLKRRMGRPRYTTLVDTAKDLLLDGRAYWIVEDHYSNGFPRSVKYAPLDQVEAIPTDDYGDVNKILYRGKEIEDCDCGVHSKNVIAFEGWNDGILHHGARIIRTALALETAARRYADVPLPSLIVKNTSNYELSQSEVTELLEGVKRARQASAVGYINSGVDLDTMGWSSEQLQLVEGRVFTNAAIANLCGIPAHFVAASNVGGSSLTYSNASQEARTLIDYGLKPLLTALESRLSMSDVLPRGHTWRFEMDSMLRGNPMERSQLYHSLIPLGVLSVAEAREWEDLAPHAENPTPPKETNAPNL